MTDNEIKKALECCIKSSHFGECFENQCPLVSEEGCKVGEETLYPYLLDLINRLQAKAIKEQNKNSKLRNERNRLQAQNKDLAETVHNLIIEKDALFDKAEELKSEIERLKTNLNVELENFATEYDNKIKAEAYKEFAEKAVEQVEKARQKYQRLCKEQGEEMEEHMHIHFNGITKIINNLLKETVGEDNG